MSHSIMFDLAKLGQSLWLDNISRSMITQGKLKALIDQGLRGQTSNPTIFKQAISSTDDYDAKIQALAACGKSAFEIYDDLTIQDVAQAADLFRGVYSQTQGLDGYVSLEINPQLANEKESQFKEGLRLWKKLARPNVMIKVPATKNGLWVVQELIALGVNVNVTLIFSAEQYQHVAWSYLKGLERLIASGGNPGKVHAVASVFVSRIDTTVDKAIDQKIDLKALRGRAAVANSEIIFHKFNQTFATDSFKKMQSQGAHIQRVLWASTGTKDPQYADVKYIEELIGADTVNTVPDKTLEAYLHHGKAAIALPRDVAMAQHTIEKLRVAGIDVNVVCNQLLQEGVEAFVKSFDDLIASVEEKTKRLSVKV